MSEKNKRAPGGGVDGCATFWKKDRFCMVGEPLIIEFNQLALCRPDFEKNDTLFQRFCSRDNIAMGVVLEQLPTTTGSVSNSRGDQGTRNAMKDRKRFLVTNVHIHWDPQHTDVKLVQSVMLMEEIEKFIAAQSHSKNLAILLCGDFNSLPGK